MKRQPGLRLQVSDGCSSEPEPCLDFGRRCVEAVYLGIYLTQSMQDIERVPIIFNSEIGPAPATATRQLWFAGAERNIAP